MTGNQIYRNNYNNGYRGQDYDRNRSRSLDRQVRGRRNDRSTSNGRSRSGSRVSTKEIGSDVSSVESMDILLGSVLRDDK